MMQYILQAAVVFHVVSSFELDPLCRFSGASKVAESLMYLYHGDQPGGTPGMFDEPVYWWESGAIWNAYIDFWSYTGKNDFNPIVEDALLWQMDDNKDFRNINFTKWPGNDDEAFWGMTAMSAAEAGFGCLRSSGETWLIAAKATFHDLASRWDESTCGGGLRWQAFEGRGYQYKNSVTNGAFFNLAARLLHHTEEEEYSQWAEKIFNFMLNSGFIDSETFAVYDGANVPDCKQINKVEWSYNVALLLGGCAFMYDHTQTDIWKNRTDRFIDTLTTRLTFFGGSDRDILFEQACEGSNTCNTDQRSFKGYLARNIGYTMMIYPESQARLSKFLTASAEAAAKACTGIAPQLGIFQDVCSLKWTANDGVFDGSTSYGDVVGQFLSVLETLQANLAVFS